VIETVDPLTVAILVTAVYFKGSWATPFSPELTVDGLFHPTVGAGQPCKVRARLS
jgi:serine protease inhibitor